MKDEIFSDVGLLDEYDRFEHRTLSHRQTKLLSDLRVDLQIVLGTLELTAEQLVDLTPGAEINCGFEVGSSVFLCMGEEIIAKGELFLRDDQLGVEIKEIANSAD